LDVRPEQWAFFPLRQFDASAKSAQAAGTEGVVAEMAGLTSKGMVKCQKWKFSENATPKFER